MAGIQQGVHILRHTFCSAFAAAPLRRDKSRRSNSDDSWLRRMPTTSKSERSQRVSPRDAPSLLRSYGAQDGAGLGAPGATAQGLWVGHSLCRGVANERKRVSHRSGAGIEGVPASDCVRGLGTKSPDQDWIAGYGDRTRLAGLGSQSITTMLSPLEGRYFIRCLTVSTSHVVRL